MNRYDVVILGSGHGGAQCAITLRQAGFAGSLAIIGRDPDPPYERPPLSKDYLAREKPFERLQIRPAAFWAERDIALIAGAEVVALDAADHRLDCADGSAVHYGQLVWSGGGDPRQLTCPGADLAGVLPMRDRAHADELMRALDAGAKRVVVVGGGYVGLEAAAVLIKLGCTVTLVEALPRVLARVAGEELSRFIEAAHRAHGVDLRLNASVEALEGEGGHVSGVRLADGTLLPADLVVVGVGIVPATAPLLAAGARGMDGPPGGVLVDEFCRTSLPDVLAIGDCAAHANLHAGGAVIRLESVQNAHDMAKVAAQTILGAPQPYRAMPWFWSNQYELKLQTVGLSTGHDTTVLRGDPATGSFCVIYLKGGAVIALDCVNAVKDYVQGRALVERGAVIAPAKLADVGVALKEMG